MVNPNPTLSIDPCLMEKKKPVKPLKRKICDAEIAGYINNKEEAQLKKTLWELMYNGFLEDKQLKRPTKAANRNGKNKPAKKESNKKQKRTTMASPPKRSSRINYDALKSLLGENHGERESEEPKSKFAAEAGDGRSEELAGEEEVEEEEGKGDYNNYGDTGLEDDEADDKSDDDNLIW